MAERHPYNCCTKQQLVDNIVQRLTINELIAVLEDHDRKNSPVVAARAATTPRRQVGAAKIKSKAEQEQLDAQLLREAQRDNLDVVERLIAEGANVNAANQNGETTLMLTVQQRRGNIVKMLITEGADPEIRIIMEGRR